MTEHQTIRFSDHLRAQTDEAHRSLEAVVPLMRPTLSLDDYRGYLAWLYHFYDALEHAVDARAPGLFEQWDIRRRVPLLAADIVALGGALPDTGNALTPRLPSMDDTAQRLGLFYVLEGSALGSRVILRHLKTHIGVSADHGASFFDPYGDRIGRHWAAYRTRLDQAGQDAAAADTMCNAADETFRTYRAWLLAGGYAPAPCSPGVT